MSAQNVSLHYFNKTLRLEIQAKLGATGDIISERKGRPVAGSNQEAGIISRSNRRECGGLVGGGLRLQCRGVSCRAWKLKLNALNTLLAMDFTYHFHAIKVSPPPQTPLYEYVYSNQLCIPPSVPRALMKKKSFFILLPTEFFQS